MTLFISGFIYLARSVSPYNFIAFMSVRIGCQRTLYRIIMNNYLSKRFLLNAFCVTQQHSKQLCSRCEYGSTVNHVQMTACRRIQYDSFCLRNLRKDGKIWKGNRMENYSYFLLTLLLCLSRSTASVCIWISSSLAAMLHVCMGVHSHSHSPYSDD